MWQEIEITNSRAKIILNSHTYQFSLSHFITRLHFICIVILKTRNPASRASKRSRLVAMYIAVAIRPRVLLIQ